MWVVLLIIAAYVGMGINQALETVGILWTIVGVIAGVVIVLAIFFALTGGHSWITYNHEKHDD